jgi:hypothetical protein
LRVEGAAWEGRCSQCRFRRYWSDGCALSRIEIGVVLPRALPTVTSSLGRALSASFSVAGSGGRIVGDPFELHQPLARHLLRSTTRFQAADPFWGENWWLRPVRPLVIAECRDASSAPPPGSRAVPVAEEHGVSLDTFTVARSGTIVRVWLLRSLPGADRDVLHRLRAHLLRLHAERMALRQILRLLATGRLDTDRGSDEFDQLQRYLLGAFRGLGQERSHGFRQDTILEAAYRADELISDDMRATLLGQLKQARLNIRRVVERQLERESAARAPGDRSIVYQNVVLGDVYEVTGQAGAVGANAQVRRLTIAQTWDELSARVDLDNLGAELERLHAELGGWQLTTQEQNAMLDVAHAAHAARRGDGPGVLEHLAHGGRWALQLARDVGVDLVAAVIKELVAR